MGTSTNAPQKLMPWDSPKFNEAVDNLLKVYWENTHFDPTTWNPGCITQVNLEMRKDGKAEAKICLRFTGED
nr:hypothetical protein [uncultured Pseudodesulfovibrio sp.]